ncbi:SurA N-terminal domain-containing protein [Sulfitobacter albidus]|uniref:SurA N-terminal domain-containing protein n=1 Tax=Sulfitobacter albidus TaxID=2829501 RepID=UPI0032AF8CFF
MAQKSSLSKTAMWILMGLLFLGLGGFGAVNLSGNIRTIGSVGEMPVGADTYARELQQELRVISQQAGRPMSFAQAQQLGLDRAVLQRLLRDRALDHEAQQIGLSIGDAALRERIVEIPAFQGINGEFDREGYAQALQSAGLNEGEFETGLREEAARQLIQGPSCPASKCPPPTRRHWLTTSARRAISPGCGSTRPCWRKRSPPPTPPRSRRISRKMPMISACPRPSGSPTPG